jgi:Mn-dependent DtxR family transcriptional regulator
LKEEQLRVLRVMSEATGHVDFAEFAKMVELSPSETLDTLKELTTTGHVRKVGGGYGLTEKGRTVLRVTTRVPQGSEFNFYNEIGKPTELSAATSKDFYEVAKKVDTSVLEFHLYRGDFENWARSALGDGPLADDLAELRKADPRGEELRMELLRAMENRYGAEAFL